MHVCLSKIICFYLTKSCIKSSIKWGVILKNDTIFCAATSFLEKTWLEKTTSDASNDRHEIIKEKLLREFDKPWGISHSDKPCIARGVNVALFNSVRWSPLDWTAARLAENP